MYDVTTIGSATQDMYVFSNQFHVSEDPRREGGLAEFFPFGIKIELDNIFFEVGGGASNAAFTFHHQGLRAACVARVGADGAGTDVHTTLQRHGITDRLIIDKKNRTGRGLIFLGRTGERTILVYRGATQEYRPQEITARVIGRSHWYYITSFGGNMAGLKKVYTQIAQRRGRVFINPGKKEIEDHRTVLSDLIKQSHVVLLNREEAALLTGRAYGNIRGMLRALNAMTGGIVVVTEGKHGAYATVDNQAWHVIIKPISGIDTTGAGDAFGSGFLAGFITRNGDLEYALTLAAHNSASVIQRIGAKHGLLKKGSLLPRYPVKIKSFDIT